MVDGHHARKLRKEGEVFNLITDRIGDLSAELRQVGGREGPALRVPHDRADEMHGDGGPDRRGIIATHAKEDTNPDLRFDRNPGHPRHARISVNPQTLKTNLAVLRIPSRPSEPYHSA